MDIEIIAELIGNVGFPIAVTIYLLRNFGVKIEALDGSIQNLTKTIASNVTERKD